MARGLNKVMLIGNLGGDPQTRSTPGGTAVASFDIATSDMWIDKTTKEQKERTEWHRCEAWGRLAEVCQEYLRKGSKVYIEGSLRTDKWQDKQGIDRWTTKIRVDEMQMLGSSPQAGAAKAATPQQDKPQPEQQKMEDFDSDIPF